MKFERKSPTCVVAIFKKASLDWQERPFQATMAARAIKETDGWRIDKCAAVRGTWLPWEPIDSVARGSLAEAKKAITEFATGGPEGA